MRAFVSINPGMYVSYASGTIFLTYDSSLVISLAARSVPAALLDVKLISSLLLIVDMYNRPV